jgi:RNA polymerase sigma-70 factor (ECF subfamily)
MTSEASDDQLLAARGAAAVEAFAVFYERHERVILAYFRRRVASSELAADLTQETFAQALVSRRRYRRQKGGSASAWLFGVAGHVLSRSLRSGVVESRARRRLGITSLLVDDEELEAIERLGGDRPATASLAELPPAQRQAVWARVVDERDYPQIAAELRCSEAVVRKRVSRGLAALRRHQLKEPA